MALCSRSELYQLTQAMVSHSIWPTDFQGPMKLMGIAKLLPAVCVRLSGVI